MDLNLHELAEAFTLDGDSDDDARVSRGSGEETGVAGCELRFEQTPSALGVTERKTTQTVETRRQSTPGVGGTVPEFVKRLLAAELKEWTLAQGELLSQGVHAVQGDIGIALQDYAARLEILGRLPCRADDASPNHSDRLQEPRTGAEQWPPPQRREDSLRKKLCGRVPHGRNGLGMRWSGNKGVGRWVESERESARPQLHTWAADTGGQEQSSAGQGARGAASEEDADDVLAAHTLCNSLGQHRESWAAQEERPPCWVAQGERAALLATAERAEVRRLDWTSEEDELIRNSVQAHGCKRWREIAAQLPGRSDDAVRNRWSRLQQQSAQPARMDGASSLAAPRVTHRPTLTHPPPSEAHEKASEQGHAHAQPHAQHLAGSAEAQGAAQRGESVRSLWTREEDDIIMRSVVELGHKWFAIGQRLPSRTEHAIRNRWARLQSGVSGGPNVDIGGGAGEARAPRAHQASAPRAMPVATATAPQPTLGAVAVGVSAALSHQATVAAHSAFPSTHGVKRAAPPQELPPSKQPCLAPSARPLQAVQPAWVAPQGGVSWKGSQPRELSKPGATHYRITHESSMGYDPFHKM